MLILIPPSLILFLLFCSIDALALLTQPVQLDQGTYIGTTSDGLDLFLGIPYAHAPRFDLPVALGPENSKRRNPILADRYGQECFNQPAKKDSGLLVIPIWSPFWSYMTDLYRQWKGYEGFDCLNMNIVRPTGIPLDVKLPVMVFIYGGGYTAGYTSNKLYSGFDLVTNAVERELPIIYVSFNYRVSAHGFLAGKEVMKAGVANIGLHDQRMALRWVKQNIEEFGGDPERITLWGHSAGAMSVSSHLLAFGGNHENLFRAAIMQSGAALPVKHVLDGQADYDNLVKMVGCRGERDTLNCLRRKPINVIQAALQYTKDPFDYTGMAEPAWSPRVDGVFFEDNPYRLVTTGRVASVPIISTNTEDEGTWFALASTNVTEPAQAEEYLKDNFFAPITPDEAEQIWEDYPSDPEVGSPFRTGLKNVRTTQFKRVAAVIGDLGFQSPRRNFLEHNPNKRYTYLFRRHKGIPYVGAFHGSDLFTAFGGGDIQDYFLNFAYSMDPNKPISDHPVWPAFDNNERLMLDLYDVGEPIRISRDIDRLKEIAFLQSLTLKYGGRHREE